MRRTSGDVGSLEEDGAAHWPVEARYGGEWRYLYNPVPVDRWAERTPECSRDGTFRLLYSGSIIDNAQKSSLRDVSEHPSYAPGGEAGPR